MANGYDVQLLKACNSWIQSKQRKSDAWIQPKQQRRNRDAWIQSNQRKR